MCRGLESLPFTCLERAKQLKALFAGLRQKADLSSMGHSNKTDTQRLNRNEPLDWDESFEKLLSSQNGVCLFSAFLQSEFSEENIAFYLACEEYKATKSSNLPVKAQEIYDTFISTDAPREVNLDHETKAITKENMKKPDQLCFDVAQARIHVLMEKDCYPRFLKSPAYLELLKKSKTG